MENIKSLANDCLNCKIPKCRTGCPVSTNIPEFIECIKNNKMEDAYEILQKNNIMSNICSKICPAENQCVGNCIKGIKGNPVKINQLEEYVNNWAKENSINYDMKIEKENNNKVAIIGGGPAGIACAVELRTRGYDITIFEKEEALGGLLEYEIPDFRLDKNNVRKIEEKIKEIGIKIKLNTEFGKDIDLDDIKKHGFEAVFLGMGLNVPNTYKLANCNCKNIYTANEILRKYHDQKTINNLGKTFVIGGGNVAMDVARTIKKAGNSKVTIVYRRNKELMPAIRKEREEAQEEGIDILYNTRVIEAVCNNENRLSKIKCVKTKIENEKVEDISESEYELEADSIVFAIGNRIDETFYNKLGIETKNGLIKIDENNMTSISRSICRRRFNRKKTNSL